MNAPKTIEERVGILEKGEEDCQGKQDERYKGMMKRIERIENKLVGALGIGIVVILGLIANIVIAIVK